MRAFTFPGQGAQAVGMGRDLCEAYPAAAEVFEAVDEKSGRKVAIKRTQKAGNIISREYEILYMLRGKPNIVQMLDFFYSVDESNRVIQNTVLEFCDCSLEAVIKEA